MIKSMDEAVALAKQHGVAGAELSFAMLSIRRSSGKTLADVQQHRSQEVRKNVDEFRAAGVSEDWIIAYIRAREVAFVDRMAAMTSTLAANRHERRALKATTRRR